MYFFILQGKKNGRLVSGVVCSRRKILANWPVTIWGVRRTPRGKLNRISNRISSLFYNFHNKVNSRLWCSLKLHSYDKLWYICTYFGKSEPKKYFLGPVKSKAKFSHFASKIKGQILETVCSENLSKRMDWRIEVWNLGYQF